MLGVTPPIAAMQWPAGTQLTAIDWAEAMLRRVLPRDRAQAVRGDWRALPLADATVDIAISDNCFMVLGSLADADRVAREVHRVLRPGGVFCLRALFRPDDLPAPAELIDTLVAGRIVKPEIFRWQFAMALQAGSPDGIRLATVWQAWRDAVADPLALCRRHGWPDQIFAGFDRWKDLACRYTFPSRGELLELAGRHFDPLLHEAQAGLVDLRFARIVLHARHA